MSNKDESIRLAKVSLRPLKVIGMTFMGESANFNTDRAAYMERQNQAVDSIVEALRNLEMDECVVALCASLSGALDGYLDIQKLDGSTASIIALLEKTFGAKGG